MLDQVTKERIEHLCVEAINSLGEEADGRAINDYVAERCKDVPYYGLAHTYTALARLEKRSEIRYISHDSSPRTYAHVHT